jgi:uncharacterized membrane protein
MSIDPPSEPTVSTQPPTDDLIGAGASRSAVDVDEQVPDAEAELDDEPEARPPWTERALERVRGHWLLGPDPYWGALGLVLTGCFVLYYFVHFGSLTSEIHRGYGDSAFDIGLYDQGLWLLSRFHAPFITEMGRNLFGDHTQFLLLALVPFYWIRPDATTLLWIQAGALAAGAIPVYMLSMRRLANPFFATVFAGAFLLHPALAQTNLENFHPDALLVPILGFAIYAAIENKPRMFLVFSVLALLGKEDVVLILLPLVIWFAWRRNRRLGITIAFGAIAYTIFATYGVMRSLIGVPTLNQGRIPFGGVSGVAKEILKKPADFVKYLIKGDSPNGRPFYVWQLIAPTGLMFLVAPEVALTGALVVGTNVLSNFGYQHQIAYHYTMVILPALSMGTVFAVSKLKKETWRRVAVGIVAVSSVWTAYIWGPFPFALHHDIPHWSPSYPPVAAINDVRAKLPPNASVAAYYSFVPHIDHRKEVYVWPTPFHAALWGTYKQEGQRLPQADTVQYVMLPTNLTDHPEVLREIQDQFEVVAQSSNAVLYKRKGT